MFLRCDSEALRRRCSDCRRLPLLLPLLLPVAVASAATAHLGNRCCFTSLGVRQGGFLPLLGFSARACVGGPPAQHLLGMATAFVSEPVVDPEHGDVVLPGVLAHDDRSSAAHEPRRSGAGHTARVVPVSSPPSAASRKPSNKPHAAGIMFAPAGTEERKKMDDDDKPPAVNAGGKARPPGGGHAHRVAPRSGNLPADHGHYGDDDDDGDIDGDGLLSAVHRVSYVPKGDAVSVVQQAQADLVQLRESGLGGLEHARAAYELATKHAHDHYTGFVQVCALRRAQSSPRLAASGPALRSHPTRR